MHNAARGDTRGGVVVADVAHVDMGGSWFEMTKTLASSGRSTRWRGR